MKEIAKQFKRSLESVVHPLILPKRRFQAYCVGAMKSGTHSLAGLFADHYRASHEPESLLLSRTILDSAKGLISDRERAKFMRNRDRRLWLELDSSYVNVFFVDVIAREFPDARIILTIRDCYSWIDSCINHHLQGFFSTRSRRYTEGMMRLLEWWFATDEFTHAEEEAVLVEHGLYPLECYLVRWAIHNGTVLETVPQERLLVVRTHEIAEQIPRIAEFLGIPEGTLNPSKAHLFKAKKKHGILERIDRGFFEEKVERPCKDLMKLYFPEIKSFDDAIRSQ